MDDLLSHLLLRDKVENESIINTIDYHPCVATTLVVVVCCRAEHIHLPATPNRSIAVGSKGRRYAGMITSLIKSLKVEKGRTIMATLRKPHLVKYTPAPGEDPLSDAYRRASWLGFVTGLRSMTPSALLAWTSDEPSTALKAITGFMAVGEIIGDKLPMTPSRLSPGPFLGRIAFGALAGTLVSRRFHQAPLQGAIRGAIGAAVGSVVGNSYRSLATQGLGIPDVVAALVEDSVAITVGLRAVGTVPSVAQLGIHRPDLAELTEQ